MWNSTKSSVDPKTTHWHVLCSVFWSCVVNEHWVTVFDQNCMSNKIITSQTVRYCPLHKTSFDLDRNCLIWIWWMTNTAIQFFFPFHQNSFCLITGLFQHSQFMQSLSNNWSWFSSCKNCGSVTPNWAGSKLWTVTTNQTRMYVAGSKKNLLKLKQTWFYNEDLKHVG